MTRTLREIFEQRDGKSSDKWEHYLFVYERLFASRRDQPLTLIEIGVQNGGSLELWARVFPKARHIIGVDVDPKVGDLRFEDPRIRALVADGTEAGVLEAIGDGPFPADIVIDDGSHLNDHVIKSFLLFFPRLRDGGLYVVEDTHSSYFAEYGSRLFAPGSMMSFFQRLSDVINHEHWDGGLSVEGALAPILALHGLEPGELDWLAQMDAITFTNSMIIIEKRAATETGLGRRLFSGGRADVVPGLDVHAGRVYRRQVPFPDPHTPRQTPEQRMADLDAAVKQGAVEVARLKAELDAAKAEGRFLRASRDGLATELDAIRRSVCGRVRALALRLRARRGR